MLLRAVLEPSPPVAEQLRLVCDHLAEEGMRPVPPDRLEVVLGRFGNVTPDVAHRLADRLVEALADVPGCVVAFRAPRVHGGAVVADLAGELDRLRTLASVVTRTAQADRIYVDRRVFRSGVVLAELDPTAPGAATEVLVDRLSGWHSSPWLAAGVTLLRTGWRGTQTVAERWCEVPLVSEDEEHHAPLG